MTDGITNEKLFGIGMHRDPDIVPTGVAAEIAGVSRETIDQWARQGLIQKVGYGRSVNYPKRRPSALFSAKAIAEFATTRGTIIEEPQGETDNGQL